MIPTRCSRCGCHTAAAPFCFYCRKPTTQHAEPAPPPFPTQQDWDSLLAIQDELLRAKKLREEIEERYNEIQVPDEDR